MVNKVNLGNWHDGIGTSRENSPNREAANKHIKGSKRYKEMIDKDSRRTGFWKNLPFSFSKPAKKSKHKEDIYHICDNCSYISLVSKFRVGQTCFKCKKYSSVNDTNIFYTEHELLVALNEKEVNTVDE